MSAKTNAVRLVQQAGFPCEEAFYEYDENDLNGNHAANAIGLPAEQVFKTLVARGARTGINVFCIPVCCALDLKAAAKAAGDKSMEMLPVKELLGMNFYIPDYQRGYRWTEQQATELLEDILTFAKKAEKLHTEIYCVQPLVVQKKATDIRKEIQDKTDISILFYQSDF